MDRLKARRALQGVTKNLENAIDMIWNSVTNAEPKPVSDACNEAHSALVRAVSLLNEGSTGMDDGQEHVPDLDAPNRERAGWADHALCTFIAETQADPEDAVSDLLGDLMHWCDFNNQSFNEALERAPDHYVHETTDEKGT